MNSISANPSAHGTLTATRHYTLVCDLCGRSLEDDGVVLDCPASHPPALLRTSYAEEAFTPRPDRDGLFRYQDWLPVVRAGSDADAGRTAVYRSTALAGALGLGELWIAFNGYWPERGAALATATFKEFEAHAVLGRLPENQVVLTTASSGNTGAAFAWACSRTRTPAVLVVPGTGLRRLRFREELDPCVTLVVVEDGGYPDAIALAAAVGTLPPFQIEGGVKNVARRDGLGTVMLSAFEQMRALPTHYFQAVGSGTGAIAVLEAAKRLRAATCHDPLPRLMLCQNEPFTPIRDAWLQDPYPLDGEAPDRFRKALNDVVADELTNLAPPYSVTGGVRDALLDSGGDVLAADNDEVTEALTMFQALEGIDIEPAAGVAVAGLRAAAEQGKLDRDSVVLLNITGGGRARLAQEHRLVPARPALRVTRDALARLDETVAAIAAVAGA
ncbi:cysteate synthase [Catenulispora sp. MAP5-51]|uniref:cysteate synthase n=1 Tax=Catenulispora sp. MAP5-51 TaxID=3156298 RepID=UPI00351792D6